MTFNPKFAITPKINKALVEIERVRGFLDAVKLKDEWISDMQKKALILESHHSTHIEGTALNLKQAQDILTGKKVKGVRRDDEKELLNYKKAMDFTSKYLGKKDPVTEGLIRELHKILVAGIAQFQFVHVHPFIDGNGRTARLLSTLILYKTGYDFKRLFTISEFYDKDRPSYYSAIQSVRKNSMNMTAWLEYFVEGLKSQMAEIREKGEQLIRRDTKFQKIKKLNLNNRQEKAVKFLLQNGKITVNDYQKVASCIRRTAQRDLDDLDKRKVIRAVAKSSTDPTKHYILL